MRQPSRINGIVITREPINISLVEEVIRSHGDRVIVQDSNSDWQHRFATVYVADAIGMFVKRAEHSIVDIGLLYAGWKQAAFASFLGIKGRWNTGVSLDSVPIDHPMYATMKHCISDGISPYHASCGLLALPRMLRHVCRTSLTRDGLVAIDLDAESMAMNNVLHRRKQDSPTCDLAPLIDVLTHKRERCLELHSDYAIGKSLLNSLIFLGSVEKWKIVNDVDHILPAWVKRLATFFYKSADTDKRADPGKFKLCEDKVKSTKRHEKFAAIRKISSLEQF